MFRFFPLVSRVTPLVWVFSLLAFCLDTALLVLIGLYDIGIGIGPKLLLSGTGGGLCGIGDSLLRPAALTERQSEQPPTPAPVFPCVAACCASGPMLIHRTRLCPDAATCVVHVVTVGVPVLDVFADEGGQGGQRSGRQRLQEAALGDRGLHADVDRRLWEGRLDTSEVKFDFEPGTFRLAVEIFARHLGPPSSAEAPEFDKVLLGSVQFPCCDGNCSALVWTTII